APSAAPPSSMSQEGTRTASVPHLKRQVHSHLQACPRRERGQRPSRSSNAKCTPTFKHVPGGNGDSVSLARQTPSALPPSSMSQEGTGTASVSLVKRQVHSHLQAWPRRKRGERPSPAANANSTPASKHV